MAKWTYECNEQLVGNLYRSRKFYNFSWTAIDRLDLFQSASSIMITYCHSYLTGSLRLYLNIG